MNNDADNAWTSNATLEAVAERLQAAGAVAVVTHTNPDGDAVGSSLAIVRTLIRLGKRAACVYPPPWSPRFDSIVGDTPVVRVASHKRDVELGFEPDAVVISDTGAWSQLVEAKRWVEANAQRAIVIDHHRHGDPDTAPMRHLDTAAAAVCQPVAALCVMLLGLSSPRDLPAEIAQPLYLGLATDTGWFRHSNITSATLHLAAELLDAGADHVALYQRIEQTDRPARLRLMQRALASLAFHAEDQIAVMRLTRSDFAAASALADDAGGFVDLAMSIQSVRVCAYLTELDLHTTKASLRSKPPVNDGRRTCDVNIVAQSFGGGGHARAAGARIAKPLDVARSEIVARIEEALG